MKIDVQVLLRKDGDWWVVRGINKDIATQARDMDDALYDFERMLMGHIFLDLRAGREPLANIEAAPREFAGDLLTRERERQEEDARRHAAIQRQVEDELRRRRSG